MVRLRVHATPKSLRDEVCGWRGDELMVRVTAPPEGGKANFAVCKVVAAALGVAKSSVSVVRGETSRHKTLEVEGAGDAEVERVFGGPGAPLR
ncbi:MAG: DUF167 domain-containing protein [Coriobacteriia bacterium]|nr:DUF167 domain-containing protein [Coriobacteriia bacterium]